MNREMQCVAPTQPYPLHVVNFFMRDFHDALPAAPYGTPSSMTYVTLKLGMDSHGIQTFVGPPNLVTSWLGSQCSIVTWKIFAFMIVFSMCGDDEWGELDDVGWGELITRDTEFLPDRHYCIQACVTHASDSTRVACHFDQPRLPRSV